MILYLDRSAYDSVHLAAVEWIFQAVGNTLQFAVYDNALAAAAERMGIHVLSA